MLNWVCCLQLPFLSQTGSPGPSDASDHSAFHAMSLDASHSQHTRSGPHTPSGAAGPAPLLFSALYYPLPYSPTALQVAAMGGGAYPGTPTRSGAAVAAYGAGPMLHSHYFGGDAGAAIAADGGDANMERAGSASSDGGGDAGGTSSGGITEVTPGAYQLAVAMLAAQNLGGVEPPPQLLELASLLQTYGLVGAGAVPSLVGTVPPPSMDAGRAVASGRRPKSQPKLNPDGSVRLNARQRRTLRRAQERAMKALVELAATAHGIEPEAAAASLAAVPMLAAMGGAGSLSPPPPEPPVYNLHVHAGPLPMAPLQPLPLAGSPMQPLYAPTFSAAAAPGMVPAPYGAGHVLPLASPPPQPPPYRSQVPGSRQGSAQRGGPHGLSRFAPQ